MATARMQSWPSPLVLLNCALRTCLPLVHPCTSQRLEETAEMQVGNKQPRSFVGNDHIMVHDLHPNATKKWRKGTVIKVLGPLNYEVTIDGHSRQAHVDHLLPSTSNSAADNPVCSEEQSVQEFSNRLIWMKWYQLNPIPLFL